MGGGGRNARAAHLRRRAVDSLTVQTTATLRDRLLAEAANLPLGSQAALMRIAAACSNPEASPPSIALEASRDEGFAALLLKLSNSAYYASTNRVSDLATAISRLGLELVQALALAAPGLRLLNGPQDGLGPARRALHRHAVRSGLVARQIAPGGVDSEAALAAGLIHNLGLNVLSLHAVDEFRALCDMAGRGLQLRDVEVSILGFTHADLGARIAEQWSYPPELVAAIAEHESDEPSSALAAAVRVADIVVRGNGIGVEAPTDISPRVATLAGVDRDADALRCRLALLLDAQTRRDLRELSEPLPELPPKRQDVFIEALEALV
jgi:HD-like signal output (HDOD) protein